LGALKKERKRKKEIKERGQMSHYEKKEEREGKDPLSSPSSPQNLQVFRRGMRKKSFSKELSIHHHHSFTPTSPLLAHIPPTIHDLSSILYTCIS
jgi:hypothetical protein